jgi:hypothetical protein
MSFRTWLRRSKSDGTPPQARATRKLMMQRRNKANDQRPRPPREDQYNSDFITRYGDPFD